MTSFASEAHLASVRLVAGSIYSGALQWPSVTTSRRPAFVSLLFFFPSLTFPSVSLAPTINRVDPFLKKEWYDIKAPSMFTVRQVGKTLVTRTAGTKIASDGLKGRIFECSLADLNQVSAGLGSQSRVWPRRNACV